MIVCLKNLLSLLFLEENVHFLMELSFFLHPLVIIHLILFKMYFVKLIQFVV